MVSWQTLLSATNQPIFLALTFQFHVLRTAAPQVSPKEFC